SSEFLSRRSESLPLSLPPKRSAASPQPPRRNRKPSYRRPWRPQLRTIWRRDREDLVRSSCPPLSPGRRMLMKTEQSNRTRILILFSWLHRARNRTKRQCFSSVAPLQFGKQRGLALVHSEVGKPILSSMDL